MKIMEDYIVAAVAEYDRFISFTQKDSLGANMAVIRMEQMGRKTIGSKFACDSFLCDGRRVVFLINYDPSKPRLVNQYEIHSLFERLQEEVCHALSKTISVGIGDCQENMDGFQKSYQQAMKALEQKFYFGEKSIVSILDVPESRRDHEDDVFSAFQERLCCALKEKKMEDTVELIEEYFTRFQKERQMKPLYLKQRFMGLLLHMYKEQKIGEERYVLGLIDEVKRAETLTELWQRMSTLCQEIVEKNGRDKEDASALRFRKSEIIFMTIMRKRFL